MVRIFYFHPPYNTTDNGSQRTRDKINCYRTNQYIQKAAVLMAWDEINIFNKRFTTKKTYGAADDYSTKNKQ